MSTYSLKTRPIIGLALTTLVIGCDRIDPYSAKFQQIAIGNTRAHVIELMGEPSTMKLFEVPMMKLEHLTYQAPFGTRVYVLVLAQDHVASKSIVD